MRHGHTGLEIHDKITQESNLRMPEEPGKALIELEGSIDRVIKRLEEQQDAYDNALLHTDRIDNYKKMKKRVENDILTLKAYGYM